MYMLQRIKLGSLENFQEFKDKNSSSLGGNQEIFKTITNCVENRINFALIAQLLSNQGCVCTPYADLSKMIVYVMSIAATNFKKKKESKESFVQKTEQLGLFMKPMFNCELKVSKNKIGSSILDVLIVAALICTLIK